MALEAGWYEDPTGRHEQRYWDGEQWTEHVADGAAQATDPVTSSPPTLPPVDSLSGNRATRRKLIASLKSTGKYRKPLDNGDLAALNLFGGDWNDYANVVFSAAILETLQDIDARLERLDAVIARLGGVSDDDPSQDD